MSGDRSYFGTAIVFLVATLGLTVLGGCASSQLETIPKTASATTQTLDLGMVIAVRNVNIEGEVTNAGVYGGGVVGGALGSTVGRGTGSRIAAAVGAAAGAVVGPKIEKQLTKKVAQEITVELDDGGTVVVVQERTDPLFSAGDRVSLLEGRTGYSRVRHEDASAYYIP